MLSKMAPGDPVQLRLKGGMQNASSGQLAEKQAGEKAYYEISEQLGLNLPVFYFKPTSAAYPDTLHKIVKKEERENLTLFIKQYGNWDKISEYYSSIKKLDYLAASVSKNDFNFKELTAVKESIAELLRNNKNDVVEFRLEKIKENAAKEKEVEIDSTTTITKTVLPEVFAQVKVVEENYNAIISNPTKFKKFIPTIHWYGTNNQYHRWFLGNKPWFRKSTDPLKTKKGFVRGDFGESYLDGRPVWSKLKDAIFWTLILNLIAVCISYFISIPLGVLNAVNKDTVMDRISTVVLFMLYSLPSFWIATLLVTFVTTDYYGEMLDLFPTHGTGSNSLPDNASVFARMWDSVPYLILPVFCMTFGSFAYLSRQMRGGMVSVIKQDYIRTARAKGLSEKVIVWKHAFRNSLIPIITIFAGLLPRMIGGSIVIETIFQIPGMGKLSVDSIFARDYPVLFTVVIFAAILTMLGILLSDILYGVVDPRISFSKNKS